VSPVEWLAATITRADFVGDVAVFDLTGKATATHFFSLPSYFSGDINVGDTVAAIVYNGTIKKSVLNDLRERLAKTLPADAPPPAVIHMETANAVYLRADHKSLSVGTLIGVDAAKENLFFSCTVYHGASGGPVYVFKPNEPPKLVGFVCGGEHDQNYNRFTRITPAMIQLANQQ